MQLVLSFEEWGGFLVEIDRRLRHRFGQPGPWRYLDPVSQLVMGLIGGRTRGDVSAGAFVSLKRRFQTWENVRDGPLCDVHAAIRVVTFADVKAARLQNALRIVTASRGRLELDFLENRSVANALAWLEELPGVGRKVSAVVLNFSTLRMRALVIDTHHLRILRRLALVDPQASAAKAYERIVPTLPASWGPAELDDHHQLMKRLGQEICHHQAPECRRCPISGLCPGSVNAT